MIIFQCNIALTFIAIYFTFATGMFLPYNGTTLRTLCSIAVPRIN
jgi:hypothetical protein